MHVYDNNARYMIVFISRTWEWTDRGKREWRCCVDRDCHLLVIGDRNLGCRTEVPFLLLVLLLIGIRKVNGWYGYIHTHSHGQFIYY